MTEKRKLAFRLAFFSAGLYTLLTYYGIVETANLETNFPLYATLHEVWLCIFPLALIMLFAIREDLFYRAKYLKLTMVIMSPVMFSTILFFAVSLVFITEPSSTLVNSLYLGHLALFLFYFTKYLRLWKRILAGEVGRRYALRIEQYGWTEDVVHPEINSPKDDKAEENRPFYTKAFEKIGNFLVASAFILPTIFAMSATGTGGYIPFYTVQIFTFLIAPFIYNIMAKIVAEYLFIRHLEKEKNVIIYNGVWLV